MTAIAASEIDAHGLESTRAEASWEHVVSRFRRPAPSATSHGNEVVPSWCAVGDLRLAMTDGSVREETALDDARPAPGDVMVVLPAPLPEKWLPEQPARRTLTLPRAVLVAAGCDAKLPPSLLLEHDRPLVGVLLTVVDEVWRRIPTMDASEVEATRRALVALTAGAIRSGGGPVAHRSGLPALRARVEDWIDKNLRSGPIQVEALAAAHCVSARTIHRAFSLTGDTMTAVVRARRLVAVCEDLVHTDLTIASIAQRWSYYDPSHLGRDFRRHFGISPSEYRESHCC